MERKELSVAVIGGGIGGLAAALALIRAGVDVHVYERARTLSEVGAGVQISPNASRILHRLGLPDALASLGVKPLAWHQRRWDDGRTLAPRCFNATALCYHYSHMARRNAREYLFNDRVRLKKYFYVLRPLLAIRYVEHRKGIPPVQFEELVEAVAPTGIRASIEALLTLKRNTEELGVGDPIPEIGEFIESELERHGALFSGPGRPDLPDSEQLRSELNTVFRSAISETGERVAHNSRFEAACVQRGAAVLTSRSRVPEAGSVTISP